MKLHLLTSDLCRQRGDVLDGMGAALAGGRWSPRGKRVVYTCEQPSTAVLEALVHTGGLLPAAGLSIVTIEIPHECYASAYVPDLPPGWGQLGRDPRAAVAVGASWLADGSRLAMRVPSAVCPLDHIVLLNPLHEEMENVNVVSKTPFLLEPNAFHAVARLAPAARRTI